MEIKIDKSKVYSLEDLTSEQWEVLYGWLLENDKDWQCVSFEHCKNNKVSLKYSGSSWDMSPVEPTTNAKELFEKEQTFNPEKHYNNENGSLYKLAEQLELNHWEFDILKRLVRCRKKGQFEQDLQKIKNTIDIYLKEYER